MKCRLVFFKCHKMSFLCFGNTVTVPMTMPIKPIELNFTEQVVGKSFHYYLVKKIP